MELLHAKSNKRKIQQQQQLKKSENFWGFKVFDFVLYPKRKLRNHGKCSFTSNFNSSFNLRFRNYKNELRQKLKGQYMLIEEKKKISEISVGQNRKLGNLGKSSFNSNFHRSCNLRFRNDKNELRQKLKVLKWIKKKKGNFRGFRVFDFVLYPKLETRKSRKVFFYFRFWQYL